MVDARLGPIHRCFEPAKKFHESCDNCVMDRIVKVTTNLKGVESIEEEARLDEPVDCWCDRAPVCAEEHRLRVSRMNAVHTVKVPQIVSPEIVGHL